MSIKNSLDFIKSETPPTDSKSEKELFVFEQNKSYDKTTLKELKGKRYEQDTEHRNDLTVIFTVVIVLWLFAVMLVIMFNNHIFNLSNSVLITLLTTTTIQVLGMMIIILRDLFPGKNK